MCVQAVLLYGWSGQSQQWELQQSIANSYDAPYNFGSNNVYSDPYIVYNFAFRYDTLAVISGYDGGTSSCFVSL